MSYLIITILAAHDYAIEVEATEYVNSVHIQGNDAVEDYSYPEHDHENLYEVEAEAESESEHDEAEAEDEADVTEETHFGEETAQVRSFEEETSFPNNVAEVMPEPEPAAEEPVAEPSKLSYASIVSTYIIPYSVHLTTWSTFVPLCTCNRSCFGHLTLPDNCINNRSYDL